jgi:uncharacterized RDD family membrane protein YckC
MPFKASRTFAIQNPAWQSQLQGVALASFRSRALAFLLDGLIIVIIRMLLGASSDSNDEHAKAVQIFSLSINFSTFFSAFLAIAYFAIATYLGKGATIGKRLMKIRVVSLTHHHMSLWHCIERALGYTASWLEAGFGFLQYFTHPNNQTVHDRIAETIVVNSQNNKSEQHD